MVEDQDDRRHRLYGRRVGKPLSPLRARTFADGYPRLVVDVSTPAPLALAGLFDTAPARLHLEIGFGAGEHLVAEAQRLADTGFIGVEPFVNGMAKAVASITEAGIANIRLYDGDAADLLDWLPADSLDSVDLLYPDPWPKKRHWKRRFVSAENLARLARTMKSGSRFCVASDIPDYIAWTLARVGEAPAFTWTAESAADWTSPFPEWPGTRYEAKAIAAGRTPTYLTFRRL